MAKIKSVSTAVVNANFDWTFIRIEDDEGIVGWGESFFAPGLTKVIERIAPLIVGSDSSNIEPILERLFQASSGAGATAGIIFNALSGIDGALWDLAARSLDVPLWRLLGGRYRESVPIYADCHGGRGLMTLGPMLDIRTPPWLQGGAEVSAGNVGRSLFDVDAEDEEIDYDLLGQRATEAVERGYRILKFDLDVPGLVPEHPGSRTAPRGAEDLAHEIAAAVTQGAGPDVDIAFDLHWRYDLASATRIGHAVEEFRPLWLEDPLAPENTEGLATLGRRLQVALGGGENLVGYRNTEAILRGGALSVITPDLGKVGGVMHARRIALLANDLGISIAPHNIASPIGTAFAAQVAATFPNLIAVEHHGLDVPYYDDLTDHQVIENGAVQLTDRPGIGVVPNLDLIAKHADPTELFFGE